MFYRFKIGWPIPRKEFPWNEIRLIVFLNHTSLFEPLFVGFLPVSFLRMLSKRLVAPGADKTLNRPLVGSIYRLFSPGIVSITRKRDNSWANFMESIAPDSIIGILPEGRMKRKNGLDLEGNKMTVRGGIADVLEGLHQGKMVFAYSGGLHHINVPGEKTFRIFKTIKMNLELMDIAEYKKQFADASNPSVWRKRLLQDMQHRLETKIPV